MYLAHLERTEAAHDVLRAVLTVHDDVVVSEWRDLLEQPGHVADADVVAAVVANYRHDVRHPPASEAGIDDLLLQLRGLRSVVLLVGSPTACLGWDAESVDLVHEVTVGCQPSADAHDLGLLDPLLLELVDDGLVLLGTDVAEHQQDLDVLRRHRCPFQKQAQAYSMTLTERNNYSISCIISQLATRARRRINHERSIWARQGNRAATHATLDNNFLN